MFEKIVYENKQITSITVKWEADFSELMIVLKNFFEDNNTEHLLLDLKDSSLDTITQDHIKDLCEYAISRTNYKNNSNDNGESRVNGKTALVGSNDLKFEIDNIFKTYSEMEDSAINVSVFRSKEKALSWLEEG